MLAVLLAAAGTPGCHPPLEPVEDSRFPAELPAPGGDPGKTADDGARAGGAAPEEPPEASEPPPADGAAPSRGTARPAEPGKPREEAGAAPKEAGPAVPSADATTEPLPSVPLDETPELELDPGEEIAPIDLVTAMRLAGAESIAAVVAREERAAREAALDGTTAALLPDLHAGVGYRRHDGRLQETRGNVFDVSRSSLSVMPVVRLRTDPATSLYEHLRARRIADAARHRSQDARAEAGLEAALLYLELLKARALLDVARDDVRHAREQAELAREMVELEAELRVNLARAEAALARDEQRLLAARNELRRASVNLAVHLRLEPGVMLLPRASRVEAHTLVDPEREVADLIASAVAQRRDLRELRAVAAAARERAKGRTLAAWVPAIDVFAGYGAFGGGRGGFFGSFGDRVDAGAAVTWSFEGFGLGEAAAHRRARAQARVASLRARGLEEEIAGQVVRTWNRARSLRARLESARARVGASQQALELIETRFQAGDAIQIEVLEALSELSAARARLASALVEYTKAQHVLHYQSRGEAHVPDPSG